jgi:hypothetical protein
MLADFRIVEGMDKEASAADDGEKPRPPADDATDSLSEERVHQFLSATDLGTLVPGTLVP